MINDGLEGAKAAYFHLPGNDFNTIFKAIEDAFWRNADSLLTVTGSKIEM